MEGIAYNILKELLQLNNKSLIYRNYFGRWNQHLLHNNLPVQHLLSKEIRELEISEGEYPVLEDKKRHEKWKWLHRSGINVSGPTSQFRNCLQ